MDQTPGAGRGNSPVVTEVFDLPGTGRGRVRGQQQTGSMPRSNQGSAPPSGYSQQYPVPTSGYPSSGGRGYPAHTGGYPSGDPSQGYGSKGGYQPFYPSQPGYQTTFTDHDQIEDPSQVIYGSAGRSKDDFTFTAMSGRVAGQTPAQAEEGRSCCVSTVKVLAIAFIAAALFAGLIGTLVYTGVMDVGLLNCGSMTTDAGLYTLLAGFGSAVVAGVVYTILTCNKCETKELDQQPLDPKKRSTSKGAHSNDGFEFNPASTRWSNTPSEWTKNEYNSIDKNENSRKGTRRDGSTVEEFLTAKYILETDAAGNQKMTLLEGYRGRTVPQGFEQTADNVYCKMALIDADSLLFSDEDNGLQKGGDEPSSDDTGSH